MKKLLAIVVLLTATSGALACPMCKDSIANDEGGTNSLHDSYTSNGQNISGGINASVYTMLAVLLGMMGLVSTVIVKGVRGSDARRGFPIEPKRDDRDEDEPRS